MKIRDKLDGNGRAREFVKRLKKLFGMAYLTDHGTRDLRAPRRDLEVMRGDGLS